MGQTVNDQSIASAQTSYRHGASWMPLGCGAKLASEASRSVWQGAGPRREVQAALVASKPDSHLNMGWDACSKCEMMRVAGCKGMHSGKDGGRRLLFKNLSC